MNLFKAAEMVLEAWDWDFSEPRNKELRKRMKALRQALAQDSLRKLAEIDRELGLFDEPKQPEQEPVGYVTIENISSWAQVPSIKWFKKPTEGPLYTAPVDAVNMGQERVDETAKREQEPFIYVREDNERPFGGYEHCSEADAGAFPVYTAPPKREWFGLEDDDFNVKQVGEFDVMKFARYIEAILKERNT